MSTEDEDVYGGRDRRAALIVREGVFERLEMMLLVVVLETSTERCSSWKR